MKFFARYPDCSSKSLRAFLTFRRIATHVRLTLLLLTILPFPLLSESTSEWRNEIIHFTSRDGLPTLSIFKVLEDDRGYIWLGSNHGAVRYDGYNFRTFTTKEGLTDNTVLNVFQDAQKRIWFFTLNRELCYFQNDRIERFTIGHDGDSVLRRYAYVKLWSDPDGTIWISSTVELFGIRDGRIEKIDLRTDPRRGDGNYVLRRAGSQWVGLSGVTAMENRLLYHDSTFYSLKLQQRPGKSFSTTGMVKGRCVVSNGTLLIQFDTAGNFALRKSPSTYVGDLAFDRNGHLWVMTESGAFRYRSGDITTSSPEPFLPRKIITSVLLDRAGNYWFSDRDNGLHLVPGIAFTTLRPNPDPAENSFTSIKIYDGNIWFGDTRGSVYRLDSAYRSHRVVNGWEVLQDLTESLDFLLYDQARIWTGQQLKEVTQTGSNSHRVSDLPAGSVKTLLKLRDGTVAAGTWSGFRILRGDRLLFNSNHVGFNERTNALYEDETGRLWLGTVTGLYSYDGEEIRHYDEKNELLRNRIMAIARCSDGTLILGTRGAGALIVRGENVEQIDIEAGLESDIVRSLFVENDSTIWVGTNKGLSRIHLRRNANGNHSILNYTTAEGLPSNGINAILKHDDHLWLATDDGICRFHPDSVGMNRIPLPIEITSIQANNRSVRPGRSHTFDHDQNNIEIGFVGIGFRTFGDVIYRYRLLGYGKDTLWRETTGRNKQYLELPPGDYTFQVTAVNEDGLWNPFPAEAHIHITPHITQTAWFKVTAALLVLAVIGGIAYRLFEGQRRRHRIDSQIWELRQKMLSANMNPHFIFNALSSIQDYINQHNLYEANKFLSQFSKLIRLNMEISQKSFVPLEEEIERLQLYLSLEKLRFGDRLDYRIHIDERIDTDETLIPTMLIQPYVENAIWHGILPSKREGIVEIETMLYDEFTYRISIRDNGVGLGYQGGRSPSNHTSMSMKLNKKRLELLGRSLNRPFLITVENRLDSSGAIEGVLVTITLPLTLPAGTSTE